MLCLFEFHIRYVNHEKHIKYYLTLVITDKLTRVFLPPAQVQNTFILN